MSNKNIRVSWCGDIMLLATQREAVRAKFGKDDCRACMFETEYLMQNEGWV